jgi:uncharacterized protein (DUF697 family)
MKQSTQHSGAGRDAGPQAWTLIPGSAKEIDAIRSKCRALVLRRAAMSAGVAALPIPGLDLATDIGLLVKLIEEINAEFGLTPAQIERLRPNLKVIAYETIVGMSGMMVGKLVTRELVIRLLKRAGMKTMVRYSAKIVPVAGQVVSAAAGFAAFRAIGNQHVDACARVVQEILTVDLKTAH